MKKRTNTKKLRRTIMVFLLCAVVLGVSTYAWFIGMKKVNVSSFDINIATTEGLFLSMTGEEDSWKYTLDAAGADVTAYPNNSNTWATDGLIPMSSIGDMDSTSSTMMMYEKGSLTASPGGYRLLASRVENYAATADGFEVGKGYVAFDLFIKNLSGEEYYTDNEPLNEEAIYLNTNSSVGVATTGGVANTGIENSVRVAFAQIGRVEATTTNETNIQDIECSDVAADTDQAQVTGICRNAAIWEPNDTAHNANAIGWYNTACDPRNTDGTDVTDPSSFDESGTCGTVANGTANKTYAISREINIADNVDVYDGLEYNTYEANTNTYDEYLAADAAAKADMKLVDFDAFTDTEKNLTGTARPTFMTLAPNSITKVRVYVYLEGQDVDNYDFASLGAAISVNFGFTKERFETSDITDYDGPAPVVGTDTP